MGSGKGKPNMQGFVYGLRGNLLPNADRYDAHACYPQEKWPTLCTAVQGRQRSITATGQLE